MEDMGFLYPKVSMMFEMAAYLMDRDNNSQGYN